MSRRSPRRVDRAGVLGAAAASVGALLGAATGLLLGLGQLRIVGPGEPSHIVAWMGGILLLGGGPVALVVIVLSRAGTADLLRGRVLRLAQLGAAVSGVVVLQWMAAASIPGAPGGKRRWILALGAGLLTATLLEGGARPLVLRRLRALARWHRHGVGRGTRLGSLVVTVAAVVGTLLAGVGILSGMGRPESPDLVLADRPTRRVILIALEGLTRQQLAYWVALNERSTLAVYALNGASAYFEWNPTTPETAWRQFLSLAPPADPDAGSPSRAEGGPRSGSGSGGSGPGSGPVPGLTELARAAYPILVPDPSPATPPGRRPLLWEVAGRGGLETRLVGWPQSLAPTDLPRSQVVPAGAYGAVRDLVEGDPAAVDGGRWGDPALLTTFRSFATFPWEDWRSGATLSAAVSEVLAISADLGVPQLGFWEDRFRLRVLEGWVEDVPEAALLAVHLGFPRWVAEAAHVDDPQAVQSADDLQFAALDHLEERLQVLGASLRGGDALAFLVVPPPGPGQDAATGTAVLFGEKVAPGLSRPDVVAAADLAQGLAYLLGLRLPVDAAGAVPFGLLAEPVATSFPPAEVASWNAFGDPGN